MVTKYGVDGLRLDTVRCGPDSNPGHQLLLPPANWCPKKILTWTTRSYVPKWFLTQFQAAADVYIVGELSSPLPPLLSSLYAADILCPLSSLR